MSLQVWLPLTKDLRQQGVSNVTVTNNGATYSSTGGKLGGCYNFTTTSWQRITFPYSLANKSEFSVCLWIKIPGTTITGFPFGFCHSGDYWQFITYNNSVGIRDNASGSTGTRKDYSLGSFVANQWTHLAFTYNAGTLKTYKDGVLFSTNSTGGTAMNDYTIAGSGLGEPITNSSSYYFNGSINDFRVYDHCLSPIEVKKLSQGLILHYPLNRQGFGQENLITQAMIDADPWKSAIQGSYTIDGKMGWILANNILYSKSGGGTNNIFPGLTYDTNTQYTISFKWRDDYRTDGKSSSLYIRFKYSDGTYSQVISSKDYNYWKEEVMTSTAGKAVTAITTTYGNGGNLLFTDLKLEKGTIKTPTSPIVNSDLYNSMGLNSTTEYDCSGYCNNGEYYAYDTNGLISYTSDTPKYNVSTHIASANPTQNAASGTRYLYGHCELTNPTQMSVAFWLKPITGGYGGTTSNGQGYFCTTNYEYGDTNVGTDYQASAMNHRDGAVNMNDSASTTQCNVTFYPTIGEWHHYVYTYDGQVGRGYKDGVQIATAQFSAAKTLDSFIGVVIGFSRAGGVWRRNDACYSDFRIYATALSAEDVKQLYNSNRL